MKFHSQPAPEHAEVPPADDGRLEQIISSKRDRSDRFPEDANRCYVLSVTTESDPRTRQAQLDEILGLVHAQGDPVCGHEIYGLSRINPRTLIGKGAAREIATRARGCKANLLVIDAELSPSQTRDLEDTAGIPVCDREAVILNVFRRNARTRRARIQVEIARLEYLRPRIRGIGIDMDQQAGLTGSRGPGESASELLARRLDGRLIELKKALRKPATAAEIQRRRRAAGKRICLVGYTNAGKTSLLNALAGENLSAKHSPFETLDTTSRAIERHGGDVVLSDTVGFIRRLPDRLLESFASTLSEITEADLLLIVVDRSDCERKMHVETIHGILEKLFATDIPRFYAFNKSDLPSPDAACDDLAELAVGNPFATISTRDPATVLRLKEELTNRVFGDRNEIEVFVPYTDRETLSLIYGKCKILENDATDEGLRLVIRCERKIEQKIKCIQGKIV